MGVSIQVEAGCYPTGWNFFTSEEEEGYLLFATDSFKCSQQSNFWYFVGILPYQVALAKQNWKTALIEIFILILSI